jgi:hypothetical protein
MNTAKPAEPRPASGLVEGNDLVGVAILPLMPSDGKSLAMRLFHVAMNNGLRAKGIEPGQNGGLFGTCFIVWTLLIRLAHLFYLSGGGGNALALS